ncbi:hypothetical protein TTHERM_001264989 (macronuclear) [Tetrahymena thermophila SB210]|uniref:Dystroglycan-type cadherin-like domain-containing protein n=1 Tax=Tetrahymena thermophila (strain SB210) TaxID=312017 RepID=W7XFB3_TETTS|nr:hypothetical protein TTHERM_001264989 [Tetrahymena thermophila SB210]EWS72686.1 hypothetical protein TTHERM_001264989 [Tetrahymena thermophila SB210]|eukprot:XP_012654762.1 hypothetical protein TTHERM_001264989 [Tetrahymena thermophila SB210]
MNFYLEKVFIILITQLIGILSQGTSLSVPIWYPSSPSYQLNQQDICSSDNSATLLRCLYPPNQNCCLVYSDQCGISLTCANLNDQSASLLNNKVNLLVQDMIIQANTQNIWIADSAYIYLYTISQISQQNFEISQKMRMEKAKNAGTTTSIQQFSFLSNRLFFNCLGGVFIYDISNTNLPQLVSVIKANQGAQLIEIAPQINQLFLVDGTYRILKITNKEDFTQSSQIPINTQDQCSFPFTFVSLNYLFNNRYLIVQQTNSIIAGADITQFLQTGKCSDLQFNQLYSNNSTYTIVYITPNKQYIFLVQANIYINVIEMSYDPNLAANIFQVIAVNKYIYYFTLSLDLSFLVVSNQVTIDFFFQKSNPNYNSMTPSIINLPQIISYVDPKVSSTPVEPYDCQFTQTKAYLIYTKGSYGTYIIQEDQNSHFLQVSQSINPPPTPSETLRMSRAFNNDQNLLIGRGTIIYIYDISNLLVPVQLSMLNFGFSGIQFRRSYITKDMKYALLAGDTKGVFVVDISDLKNPFLVTTVYHNFTSSTRCYYIDMPTSEKYAVASYLYLGIIFYDFTDFKNPKIISYMINQSARSTVFFQNQNFLLKSDLQQGIMIVNVTDILNPQKQSTIKQDTSVKQCVLVQNDHFAVCTSNYLGNLLLIDLRDLNNPQIYQRYDFRNQKLSGYNVCLSSDQKTIYLGLLNTIVRVSLYSNIQFETNLLLLQRGSTQLNQLLDIKKPFELGTQVKVTLQQVYPSRQATIKGAKFYNNQNIQELPFWATFSTSDSSLSLSFTIQSISNSNIYLKGSNGIYFYTFQFIFIINQSILNYDFINQSLNIDQNLSNQIFIDCILAGLLDNNNYFNGQSFDTINYHFQQKYLQSQIQFIFYVLSSRFLYYPIQLNVYDSLIVSIEDINSIPYIDSVNSYIYIDLTVDKQQANFIPYTYSGVLTYLSDKNDWLKIEGDLNSVNLVIQKGIQLANFTQDISNINITMTFDDKVNKLITKTIQASFKHIIKLNSPILNNPQLSLQEDFEKKFSGGSINIEDTFSYTFSSSIFINKDNRQIQYEALMLYNGEYLPLSQQSWLLFQSEERTFVGTTKSSQYKQSIHLLINATDGFTYATASLVLQIDSIPISYLVLLLFQIISPLLGIIGFWKYRSSFYNFVQRKSYCTTPIEIICGEEVIFQIPLLGNKLKTAQSLWNAYFKSLDKQAIIKEFYIQKQISEPIFKNSNSKLIAQQQQDNNEIQNSKFSKQQEYFQNQKISISQSPSSLKRQLQRNLRKQTQLSQIKQIGQNEDSNNQAETNWQLVTEKQQNFLSNQKEVKLHYFNYDNTLNFPQIIMEIREQYINNSKCPSKKIIEQLNNPLSMICRALTGLATISIAGFLSDKMIQNSINYLKVYAKTKGFSEADWYKYYIIIQPQFSRIHFDQFPLIKIQEDHLQMVLNILLYETELKQEDINNFYQKYFPFIKDSLTAIALGFTQDGQGIIPKIRGECLEIKSHKIQNIKTFRPFIKKRCFLNKTISKSETLVDKELSKIQEIPSWILSIDLANNVILIKGKTQHKDIGQYVLNIYDDKHFVIKQIRVIIKPESNQECDNFKEKSPLQLSQQFHSAQNVIKPQIMGSEYTAEEDFPLEASSSLNNRYFGASQSLKSKSNQLSDKNKIIL